MFKITFTNSIELIEQLARLAPSALADDAQRPAFIRKFSLSTILNSISGFFVLIVFVPLMSILTMGIRVQGWMIIYLVIVSFIGGAVLVNNNRQKDLIPLLMALLQTRDLIEINLTDFGLEIVSGGTVARTPWEVFSKVIVTNDLILMVKSRSICYVPTKAFATNNEMLEFVSYALSKIQKGNNKEYFA
jgi:hypothetical protein